ncbi:MAG: DNA internalization-related competence protein ComEC/Rec2 [Gammaproteobacteria bacterium]|nr:DNA internalization-related competence protein ComEC/Rec2 [Gammaproteobacteria bacterium]
MSKTKAPWVLLLVCAAIVLRIGLWYLHYNLPEHCFAAAVHELEGEIVAVRQRQSHMVTLDIRSDSNGSSSCIELAGRIVRVSWYYPKQELAKGTRANFRLQLRPLWGMKNPGGFDYQRWLMGKGYAATGYVKKISNVQVSSSSRFQHALASGYQNWGLLRAVALGDQQGVTDTSWALFRATGTVHLMVVSGLHVGIYASMAFGILFGVLRLLAWQPWGFTAKQVALIFSVLAVFLFAWQSGLQPPVFRAALAYSLLVFALLVRRRISWWRGLFAVFTVAVLLQPNIVMQQGFWFSYIAVTCLLFVFVHRWRTISWVSALVLSQVALFFGLTPWLGFMVNTVPLISPLANIVAVPLMSAITIPTAMLGMQLNLLEVSTQLSQQLLRVADISMSVALEWLLVISDIDLSLGSFQLGKVVVASMGFVGLLLPIGWFRRLVSGLVFSILLMPNSMGIPPGEFRVMVLDVGQGSAVIVDTHQHRLLIDAGPRFKSGFDTGAAVVVPAVKQTGPDQLDGIVISHADIDHAGGLDAVQIAFPSAWLIERNRGCTNEATWVWDKVTFSTLTTARDDAFATKNDMSCTVIVRNARTQAYFAGDIGQAIELEFLHRLPRGIDLVVAPHHGSETSSHQKFVEHIDATFIVFSAAKDSQYGHPRESVLERYVKQGAIPYTTGLSGAVSWSSQFPEVVSTSRAGVFQY